jgi:methyltransferase (TIGR00027 family)
MAASLVYETVGGALHMLENKASRTALAVAYIRAAHQLLDAPPHILEDSVAVKLLGEAGAQRILSEADIYRSSVRQNLRSHVVVRSRFTEDCLEAGVARGVRQYIVLGAGFDTFALRQPVWALGLRICEVDAEGTQAEKRARMANAGLAIPENVLFVSIDFERETLCDGLRRTFIAPDEPAFFSWLGVTMYLTEEAIDAVLASVAAFPAGSEIVLTFAPTPLEGPPPSAVRAASVGEPWVSYFEPDTLESKLRGVGFSIVEFLSPAEAEARYFKERPQDLPTLPRTNLVRAVL